MKHLRFPKTPTSKGQSPSDWKNQSQVKILTESERSGKWEDEFSIHKRTSLPHPQVTANRYRPQDKPEVAKVLFRSEPSQRIFIILLYFLLFPDDYLDQLYLHIGHLNSFSVLLKKNCAYSSDSPSHVYAYSLCSGLLSGFRSHIHGSQLLYNEIRTFLTI